MVQLPNCLIQLWDVNSYKISWVYLWDDNDRYMKLNLPWSVAFNVDHQRSPIKNELEWLCMGWSEAKLFPVENSMLFGSTFLISKTRMRTYRSSSRSSVYLLLCKFFFLLSNKLTRSISRTNDVFPVLLSPYKNSWAFFPCLIQSVHHLDALSLQSPYGVEKFLRFVYALVCLL